MRAAPGARGDLASVCQRGEVFDDNVAAGVRSLQRRHRLRPSGIIDVPVAPHRRVAEDDEVAEMRQTTAILGGRVETDIAAIDAARAGAVEGAASVGVFGNADQIENRQCGH